jgi:phosphate/sulfate permease
MAGWQATTMVLLFNYLPVFFYGGRVSGRIKNKISIVAELPPCHHTATMKKQERGMVIFLKNTSLY